LFAVLLGVFVLGERMDKPKVLMLLFVAVGFFFLLV
jgi:uncharacterized membrane protein